nr:hypothetical protein [Microbacterium sp. AK031]
MSGHDRAQREGVVAFFRNPHFRRAVCLVPFAAIGDVPGSTRVGITFSRARRISPSAGMNASTYERLFTSVAERGLTDDGSAVGVADHHDASGGAGHEMMQAVRSGGFGDVALVGALVLEPNGTLSVIGKDSVGTGAALTQEVHP